MAERKINSAVLAKGHLFRTDSNEDQMEELNSLLTPDAAKRLSKSGVLSGDWKGNKNADEAKPTNATNEGAPRATGTKRTHGEDGVETEREVAAAGGALPVGFPGRAQLVKAGFDTQEKVKAASDDELEALEGVGDATVKSIREALK